MIARPGKSQQTEKLKVDFWNVPYNRPVCPSPVSLRKMPITVEELAQAIAK